MLGCWAIPTSDDAELQARRGAAPPCFPALPAVTRPIRVIGSETSNRVMWIGRVAPVGAGKRVAPTLDTPALSEHTGFSVRRFHGRGSPSSTCSSRKEGAVATQVKAKRWMSSQRLTRSVTYDSALPSNKETKTSPLRLGHQHSTPTTQTRTVTIYFDCNDYDSKAVTTPTMTMTATVLLRTLQYCPTNQLLLQQYCRVQRSGPSTVRVWVTFVTKCVVDSL